MTKFSEDLQNILDQLDTAIQTHLIKGESHYVTSGPVFEARDLLKTAVNAENWIAPDGSGHYHIPYGKSGIIKVG